MVYSGPASPTSARASSRMASRRPVVFSRLAVEKSQASWRSPRGIPAASSFAKMSAYSVRRRATEGSQISLPSRSAWKVALGARAAPLSETTRRIATM
jgi:hypothetical protein